MSEVNQAGYTELRAYIRNNWELVLYSPGGAEALRLDESDPRVSVGDAHPTLTYTVNLSGGDGDINPPLTLVGGRLVSGATVVAPDEPFAEGDATIGAEADEVTVTSTFTMPSAGGTALATASAEDQTAATKAKVTKKAAKKKK